MNKDQLVSITAAPPFGKRQHHSTVTNAKLNYVPDVVRPKCIKMLLNIVPVNVVRGLSSHITVFSR